MAHTPKAKAVTAGGCSSAAKAAAARWLRTRRSSGSGDLTKRMRTTMRQFSMLADCGRVRKAVSTKLYQEKNMKRLKAAVFGAGFVGRVHIEGIRRLGNVEVAAVADATDERARQLAEQLSTPSSAGDYRRVLEDKSIDAAHICTPNALHLPMAKDALAAGKHVICEKPLSVSVDAAKQMVDAAHAAKKRNCLFH